MRRALSLFLVITLIFSAALTACSPAGEQTAPQEAESTQALKDISCTADASDISKYGNILLSVTCEDFLSLGYEYGDIVSLSFLGKTVELPFCSNYSDVDPGTAGIFARDGEDYIQLAVNMGDFATDYGIAEKSEDAAESVKWDYCDGISGPVAVSISLKEAGGYFDEYLMHQLVYTNERSDYPDLTDEQFANFRAVSTSGMGKNRLFRTASPVNPEIGRNTFADAALRAAGVTVVLNLADDDAELKDYAGFDKGYYSSTKYICLDMTVDFSGDDFKNKLAEGLRFLAANPGVYAIHCTEGKDRAGFVAALLECLTGASAGEVVADYMVTYYNYYGIKTDNPKYAAIANGNIVKSLQSTFGVSDLYSADLADSAEAYMESIGLTSDEIAAVRANLSA